MGSVCLLNLNSSMELISFHLFELCNDHCNVLYYFNDINLVIHVISTELNETIPFYCVPFVQNLQ